MTAVDIKDAKTHLSQLVDKAAAGQDIVVCRNGKPVVRITRLQEKKSPVRFGVLKGRARIADDFDVSLPDSVLADFNGR